MGGTHRSCWPMHSWVRYVECQIAVGRSREGLDGLRGDLGQALHGRRLYMWRLARNSRSVAALSSGSMPLEHLAFSLAPHSLLRLLLNAGVHLTQISPSERVPRRDP